MEEAQHALSDSDRNRSRESAIIRVENLTKIFETTTKPITALHDLSFDIMEGEIFGIIGANGSGKSTCLRLLTTMLSPTSGAARVNTYDIKTSPELVRSSIGFCPQNYTCDPELSAYDNLEFHGKIQGIPESRLQNRIRELLTLIGLADRADMPVRTLSGGMRRKIEIVRAFIHHPHILILDEPTIGLDPEAREEIWQQILTLHAEQTTIIFTTQLMEEAEKICHRIAFLDHGHLVALGSMADLRRLHPSGDLIKIDVDHWDPRAEGAIRDINLVAEVSVAGHTVIISAINGNRLIQDILDVFEEYTIPIRSISISSPTLEDIFIYLTLRESGRGNKVRCRTPSDVSAGRPS